MRRLRPGLLMVVASVIAVSATVGCSDSATTEPRPVARVPWGPLGTGSGGGTCGDTDLRIADPEKFLSANAGVAAAYDCSEWENRGPGSRAFSAWAPPLIFGDYYWLDDHIGKVSYTVTASPVADGAALTGEVKYATGTGWATVQFASSVYFTTGNAVASVEARFKNNNPTGTAVTGRTYW